MLKLGKEVMFVVLVCFLLGAGLVVFLTSNAIPNPKELVEWIRPYGIWGPVIVALLMIAHSFVPFPAELLAICAGALFGTVLGAVAIWAGAMVGAVLAFGISRYFGRSMVDRYLAEHKRNTLDRWTQNQGVFALLVSRFIPIIAFNLINYAAGLTRIPLWSFVWTTALGILPITILSTYLGAHMRMLSWPLLITLLGSCFLVVWLCRKLARHKEWI